MSHPDPQHDPENVLPDEPIYGHEDWQQQMDEEQRRQQEEEDAVNRYADAMIRRDKAAPAYDPACDTAPDGRPLLVHGHTYESWCKAKGTDK